MAYDKFSVSVFVGFFVFRGMLEVKFINMG